MKIESHAKVERVDGEAGWVLLENGKELQADLIVGADGMLTPF